jgi:hypothetical protein
LQGLIQVAAGYYKALEQRRPASAARLLGRGLAKLEAGAGAGGWTGEIDLAGFCAAVRAGLEAVEAGTWTAAQVPALGHYVAAPARYGSGSTSPEPVEPGDALQASGPNTRRRPSTERRRRSSAG